MHMSLLMHRKEIVSSKESYEFLHHLVEKIQGDPLPIEGEKEALPIQNKLSSKQKTPEGAIATRPRAPKPKLDGTPSQGKRGRPRKIQATHAPVSDLCLNLNVRPVLLAQEMMGQPSTTHIETAFDETDYD